MERAERNLAPHERTGIVQIGQYLSEVKERLGHGRPRTAFAGHGRHLEA
jgi:hypothetical protein